MKRRAFLACLVVPLLAGCGGGTGPGIFNDASATFRGATPLTHSLLVDGGVYRLAVSFQGLKAKTRAGVGVRLRLQAEPTQTLPGLTFEPQTTLTENDQFTVVTFNTPQVGTYFLEAVDSDGTVITTDTRGNTLLVTITP